MHRWVVVRKPAKKRRVDKEWSWKMRREMLVEMGHWGNGIDLGCVEI